MKEIILTKSRVAMVDDDDFDLVSRYKWFCSVQKNTCYAKSRIDGNTIIFMHRLIMDVTDPKIEVDHKNHDGLCNLKANLRVCTHQQNMHNQKLSKISTSGFKGVNWDKTRNKWKCKIKFNGIWKNIGRFTNKEDAARAYDLKAKELFGEFARTNFKESS